MNMIYLLNCLLNNYVSACRLVTSFGQETSLCPWWMQSQVTAQSTEKEVTVDVWASGRSSVPLLLHDWGDISEEGTERMPAPEQWEKEESGVLTSRYDIAAAQNFLKLWSVSTLSWVGRSPRGSTLPEQLVLDGRRRHIFRDLANDKTPKIL